MKFSKIARQQVVPYWEGSFSHPFLTELQAGTLDPAIFRYYLIQDAYYLKHFSRLYALIAQQAQESDLKAYAAQSAAGLTEGELAVRRDFFDTLMITDAEVAATAIAPTAYHYVSHMYGHRGDVAVSVVISRSRAISSPAPITGANLSTLD